MATREYFLGGRHMFEKEGGSRGIRVPVRYARRRSLFGLPVLAYTVVSCKINPFSEGTALYTPSCRGDPLYPVPVEGRFVQFRTPRWKVGSVALFRDLRDEWARWGSPVPEVPGGPEGDDVVLSFHHDNGDGTTPEQVVWSRARRAWSMWPADGAPVVWSPSLRDVLCGHFMADEDVADALAFFGDPGLWADAALVMES